jgi:WD40 repeat protein
VWFGPDARTIISAAGDQTVRIWELASGRESARAPYENLLYRIAKSQDGRYVATSTFTRRDLEDGRTAFSPHAVARVWDTGTGAQVAEVSNDEQVTALAFGPSGEYLATGTYSGRAEIWDVSTGNKLASMPHEGQVERVTFSPDGRYLATASRDKTARVWDVATAQEVDRVIHEDGVNRVVFSPDGRYLATTSNDQTTRVWLMFPENPIEEACARLSRNLTPEEWREYLGDEPYHKTCPDLGRPRAQGSTGRLLGELPPNS